MSVVSKHRDHRKQTVGITLTDLPPELLQFIVFGFGLSAGDFAAVSVASRWVHWALGGGQKLRVGVRPPAEQVLRYALAGPSRLLKRGRWLEARAGLWAAGAARAAAMRVYRECMGAGAVGSADAADAPNGAIRIRQFRAQFILGGSRLVLGLAEAVAGADEAAEGPKNIALLDFAWGLVGAGRAGPARRADRARAGRFLADPERRAEYSGEWARLREGGRG